MTRYVRIKRERERDNLGIVASIVNGSLSGRPGSRKEVKAEVRQRIYMPLECLFDGSEIAAACAGDAACIKRNGGAYIRSSSTIVKD